MSTAIEITPTFSTRRLSMLDLPVVSDGCIEAAWLRMSGSGVELSDVDVLQAALTDINSDDADEVHVCKQAADQTNKVDSIRPEERSPAQIESEFAGGGVYNDGLKENLGHLLVNHTKSKGEAEDMACSGEFKKTRRHPFSSAVVGALSAENDPNVFNRCLSLRPQTCSKPTPPSETTRDLWPVAHAVGCR